MSHEETRDALNTTTELLLNDSLLTTESGLSFADDTLDISTGTSLDDDVFKATISTAGLTVDADADDELTVGDAEEECDSADSTDVTAPDSLISENEPGEIAETEERNITSSITDEIENEVSRKRTRKELLMAYNTGEKRFEKATGLSCINNDVVKLNPVSN